MQQRRRRPALREFRKSCKALASRRALQAALWSLWRTLSVVVEAELVLPSGYRAFNARDVEAAVELMHRDADWPNAWEGGRVVGRAAVRGYWVRQFAAISSHIELEHFTEEDDGTVTVDVHQVVRDAETGGALLSDSRVRHRYRLGGALVVRMDVLDAARSK